MNADRGDAPGPEVPVPPKARFALAVLLNGRDEALLLRRSRGDSFAPGRWGLPGGHLGEGETPEDAIARELAEELGTRVRLSPVRRVGPVRDTLYGGVFEIHLFLYRYAEGAIVLNAEHEDYAWVARDAYRDYPVVDGVDEDFAHLGVWP